MWGCHLVPLGEQNPKTRDCKARGHRWLTRDRSPPRGQGRRWGLHRGVPGVWAMVLDLASPAEGSHDMHLSAVYRGDYPSMLSPIAQGDPEGINSCTIFRLPAWVPLRSSKQREACSVGWVSGRRHMALGPRARPDAERQAMFHPGP